MCDEKFANSGQSKDHFENVCKVTNHTQPKGLPESSLTLPNKSTEGRTQEDDQVQEEDDKSQDEDEEESKKDQNLDPIAIPLNIFNTALRLTNPNALDKYYNFTSRVGYNAVQILASASKFNRWPTTLVHYPALASYESLWEGYVSSMIRVTPEAFMSLLRLSMHRSLYTKLIRKEIPNRDGEELLAKTEKFCGPLFSDEDVAENALFEKRRAVAATVDNRKIPKVSDDEELKSSGLTTDAITYLVATIKPKPSSMYIELLARLCVYLKTPSIRHILFTYFNKQELHCWDLCELEANRNFTQSKVGMRKEPDVVTIAELRTFLNITREGIGDDGLYYEFLMRYHIDVDFEKLLCQPNADSLAFMFMTIEGYQTIFEMGDATHVWKSGEKLLVLSENGIPHRINWQIFKTRFITVLNGELTGRLESLEGAQHSEERAGIQKALVMLENSILVQAACKKCAKFVKRQLADPDRKYPKLDEELEWFINEFCDAGPDFEVGSTELYNHYQHVCGTVSRVPTFHSVITFSRAIRRQENLFGIARKHVRNAITGLKIRGVSEEKPSKGSKSSTQHSQNQHSRDKQ